MTIDITETLARMNKEQLTAVQCTEGPLLVLAGAGSGKTTVLVHRIAHIVALGEQAWRVLAITFTNKAANEMKERLRAILGEAGDELWAGTFHSICAKLLRRHGGGIAGFDSHFAIYDTDDSKRVMKEVQRQLRIDDKFLPHKAILGAVSRAKDQLISPQDYLSAFGNDARQQQIAQAYAMYQAMLQKANAKDFDDIIVHTVQMLEENAEVRAQYQRRFRYILVDEYQDTNHAQYRLVSLLAAGHGNLCVVGDDDQSIYRFRGATIENILQFEKQYKDARTIRLEQNYRSTQHILDAANKVIANNEGRKGKKLWTDNNKGEEIAWRMCEDERDEARQIADMIQKSVQQGAKWSDNAVLYRANALSNTIESQMVRAGVPYRIIGGHRFYERKEIRDAIAYLTVIANPADEVRLRRIINEPKRGIGDTTVQHAANLAAQHGVPLYQILQRAGEFAELSRASAKIGHFVEIMQDLRRAQEQLSLKDLLEYTLQRSGYLVGLAADKETENDRKENLQELASNLLRYEEEEDEPTLWGFLEDVALQSDIDQYNAQADAVVLMTLHSAKGLEFPTVFLPAWEERVFPSYQTVMSGAQDDLEEERRLAYVGITRARQKLTFTTARSRMLYGSTQYNPPSRFLRETGLEEPERVSGGLTRMSTTPYVAPGRTQFAPTGNRKPAAAPARAKPAAQQFAVGERVKSAAFGEGMVLAAKPMGNDTLLEIAFDSVGTKKVMLNYAKLEKIE
ncbi:MAG: UvrD-helicase domain-containing protein [Oscillospiraceae bacterium]|nr:UvrD-helicase domain-containing protein [Oscillospiraceae bacterium]